MVRVSCWDGIVISCVFLAHSLVIFSGIVLLGWSENLAVCKSRVINQGEVEVNEVGCDSESLTASNGKLVLFSCDLSKAGLAPIGPQNTDWGDFAFVGTGLRIEVGMFQCVERASTGQEDGDTKGPTIYNYQAECPENPQWPSGLPTSGVTYAPSAHVGAFMLSPSYVEMVPLSAPVYANNTPSGWEWTSDEQYVSTKWRVSPLGIGEVRVKFWGTDWNHPKLTVLGQNNNGLVERWTTSDSWFCSDLQLAAIANGTVSKADLLEALRRDSDNQFQLWFLRFIGFFVIWSVITVIMCSAHRDDSGSCLCKSCIVSCVPAAACATFVIGIIWVELRPDVGLPLVIIGPFLLFGGFVSYKTMRRG